jgi:death-on-curing protein
MRDPVFLCVDDVLHIHEHNIATRGGTLGIREIGLLESAIATPQASFGGEFLHCDLFEMAAAYLFHIVMDHPFIDGNKRAGFSSAIVFLDLNRVEATLSETEAYDLVIGVCEGLVSKQEIAAAFRKHARSLED